jgi:hypothetical protein
LWGGGGGGGIVVVNLGILTPDWRRGEERMFSSLLRYMYIYCNVYVYMKSRAELVALCFFSIGKAKRNIFSKAVERDVFVDQLSFSGRDPRDGILIHQVYKRIKYFAPCFLQLVYWRILQKPDTNLRRNS